MCDCDKVLIEEELELRSLTDIESKIYEENLKKQSVKTGRNLFKIIKEDNKMCDCDKVLIEEEFDVIKDYFGNKVEDTKEICVMYDNRGYIRLGDPSDMNCLDHGEKFKVNFCPICGEKVE